MSNYYRCTVCGALSLSLYQQMLNYAPHRDASMCELCNEAARHACVSVTADEREAQRQKRIARFGNDGSGVKAST